jgi:hypothetical protein
VADKRNAKGQFSSRGRSGVDSPKPTPKREGKPRVTTERRGGETHVHVHVHKSK